MADTEPRSPLLVTCRSCKHVWPILWLPCETALVEAVATQPACPWCGDTKRFFHPADRAAGDLDRYAAWLETELLRARKDAADG